MASRLVWPGGVGPPGCAVSVAPCVGAEVEAVGVLGVAELSSVIWCRSCASAVRLASVSVGEGPQSEVADLVAGCRVTAAIADVTGCCPVSSNAVVIQGILASTTDSPGPEWGIPGSCGEVFQNVSGALDVVVSTGPTRRRWRSPSTTNRQGVVDRLDHRVAAPFKPMTTRRREAVSTHQPTRRRATPRRAGPAGNPRSRSSSASRRGRGGPGRVRKPIRQPTSSGTPMRTP